MKSTIMSLVFAFIMAWILSGCSHAVNIDSNDFSADDYNDISIDDNTNSDIDETEQIDDTPIIVSFNGVTANGSSSETTTKLTIRLSQNIELDVDDIKITGINVDKGSLIYKGMGIHELSIDGFDTSGIITLSIKKYGYDIQNNPHDVLIYYVSPIKNISFDLLSANTTLDTIKTKLTLVFDNEIEELSSSDIILSGISGIIKGTLTYNGNGEYELPISGSLTSGLLTVTVKKPDYTILNDTKNVNILIPCLVFNISMMENESVLYLFDYVHSSYINYLESFNYEDIIERVSIFVKTNNGLVKVPSGDLGENAIIIPEFSMTPVRVFYDNYTSQIRFRTSSAKGNNYCENDVDLIFVLYY